ncbi:hypothetical protein BBI01_22065 [Chryseobacterium artocarpi]|uniref:Uncharacterized protein n=1 Tax=Chryseobacterium artocarpi TaxID=1414727 RepID=A0A1B8ZYM8_9FLAO|nr:hypothetical protein [Chryseobacterium artocarpi]OCA76701.1 hypothetical protein BBI01_22065 [Chryseobacterium artocarpi]
MSRLRIVKGKITEKIEGDYNLYSESNIVYNAAETVSNKGVDKGVSYGKPSNPPSSQIKVKCLVEFRPHGNWKGEFGFDWIRMGDSGLVGDKHWVKDILGKHYTNSNLNVVTPYTNSWTDFFKKWSSMYDNLLNSFKKLQINWKSTKGNPFFYRVPVIAIVPNENIAKLSLKIEIQEIPKKLEIKPQKENTGLIFNKTIIPIKKGKYNLYNFLTIKASKPLKEDIYVDVLADDEVCGQFKVLANDNNHIKKINVIIVPVKTKLGAVPKIGKMVSDGDSFFRQNLIQSLIKPNIRYLIKPLDLSTTPTFKNRYSRNGVIFSSDGSLDGSNIEMLDYLDNELNRTYPGRYTNFYKLYFLLDAYPDPVNSNLVTQGFSNLNTMHGVFFNYHDRSTISHETFHAMGLAHTFDGIKAAAKYTYKAQQTDNIMDYCHWSSDLNGNPRTPVEGKILFGWQWQILNSTIKIK